MKRRMKILAVLSAAAMMLTSGTVFASAATNGCAGGNVMVMTNGCQGSNLVNNVIRNLGCDPSSGGNSCVTLPNISCNWNAWCADGSCKPNNSDCADGSCNQNTPDCEDGVCIEVPSESPTQPASEPTATAPAAPATVPAQPQTTAPSDSSDFNTSYADEVISLVNAERAKYGLAALSKDNGATAVAQVRAKEIVQSFSHTRPNGTSCFTAASELGVSYRSAGENIAYGYPTPQSVVEGWMNSEGHRANILSQKFTSIGVGCYKSGNTLYWSQFFIG